MAQGQKAKPDDRVDIYRQWRNVKNGANYAGPRYQLQNRRQLQAATSEETKPSTD